MCVLKIWLRKHLNRNSVIAISNKNKCNNYGKNQCAATEMNHALINLSIWSIKIYINVRNCLHYIEWNVAVRCMKFTEKFPQEIHCVHAIWFGVCGSLEELFNTWNPWCICTWSWITLRFLSITTWKNGIFVCDPVLIIIIILLSSVIVLTFILN